MKMPEEMWRLVNKLKDEISELKAELKELEIKREQGMASIDRHRCALMAELKEAREKLEKLKVLCLRESGVLTEALKRKNNKSMIAVVAYSLAEQALK